ncbi:MAG TPA: Gfo/Idh/MocA family oxidoreductase [bacterium]|nr:Gfo/Idh/MocA family oxidoreductase [bacterium]HPR89088.1 Gfo/Idh/MocA family oxidoreductase [bacterium]
MLNIGVIGVGYWGPNLIRNFDGCGQTNMVIASDLKPERLAFIQKKHPALKTTADYREIINDPSIDAVAISTPVFTHHQLAKEALQAGKHVFLEKPMTSTAQQAEELVNLAAQKKLTLMLDHTFIYTGAVQLIKKLIDAGEIGDLYYFDSVRINLGLFQHDVNVIWDLAPHDISIMDHLLQLKPEGVVATGADHVGKGHEDVAYLTVYFPGNIIAHIHANWLSPVKIRQTLIAGTKKMIVWDDNIPTDKIKIYDSGITVNRTKDEIYDTLIQYRTGDMWAPKVPLTEALSLEVNHFAECIQTGKTPITDGVAGFNVVRILEASEQSIKARGKEIRLA